MLLIREQEELKEVVSNINLSITEKESDHGKDLQKMREELKDFSKKTKKLLESTRKTVAAE